MPKKTIIFLLLLLMHITANARTNNFPKRKKPLTNHNFRGVGIVIILGGTTGKYFKTYHLANSHVKTQLHNPAQTKKVIAKQTSLLMPSLKINFIGGTDRYKDSLAVDSIIKPLATYLITNSKAKINLIGNTGGDNDPKVPTGKGNNVYNAKTVLNGMSSTYGQLMKARAETVKKYLVNNYQINPKRIKTLLGTNQHEEENRTVGIECRKLIGK